MVSTSSSENPAPATIAWGAIDVDEEALEPMPEEGLVDVLPERSWESSDVAACVEWKTVTTGEQFSSLGRDEEEVVSYLGTSSLHPWS